MTNDDTKIMTYEDMTMISLILRNLFTMWASTVRVIVTQGIINICDWRIQLHDWAIFSRNCLIEFSLTSRYTSRRYTQEIIRQVSWMIDWFVRMNWFATDCREGSRSPISHRFCTDFAPISNNFFALVI